MSSVWAQNERWRTRSSKKNIFEGLQSEFIIVLCREDWMNPRIHSIVTGFHDVPKYAAPKLVLSGKRTCESTECVC